MCAARASGEKGESDRAMLSRRGIPRILCVLSMISPVSLAPPPANVDLSPLAAMVAKLGSGPSRDGNAPLQCVAMTGGASTRRYFRVALPGGATAVAMFVPEGGRPEEVQKLHDGPRWP